MLVQARKHLPDADLRQTDLHRLPLPTTRRTPLSARWRCPTCRNWPRCWPKVRARAPPRWAPRDLRRAQPARIATGDAHGGAVQVVGDDLHLAADNLRFERPA
ncbi:MAG: hypothetical protein ACRDSP_00160 [Pseudonocardiaceae bacterium]